MALELVGPILLPDAASTDIDQQPWAVTCTAACSGICVYRANAVSRWDFVLHIDNILHMAWQKTCRRHWASPGTGLLLASE